MLSPQVEVGRRHLGYSRSFGDRQAKGVVQADTQAEDRQVSVR